MAGDRNSTSLRRKLGMTRRDLLRRGAVVGGTLIWTIPVISSISRAHQGSGSPLFGCCYCPLTARKGQGKKGICKTGIVGESSDDMPDTGAQCSDYCRQQPGTTGSSSFHSGPNPITCTSNKGCGPH